MATSGKIDDMPLSFPAVEQYFKRLRFHITATDRTPVAKAILLSSCGSAAFSLIETLVAPAAVEDEAIMLFFILLFHNIARIL